MYEVIVLCLFPNSYEIRASIISSGITYSIEVG